MSDLISRQHAIDEIRFYITEPDISDDETKIEGYNDGLEMAISILSILSSAESERKKGKWVKVSGYFTPGGDPVWKCSECGKGMHVYGIEAPSYNKDYADGQWVACPNCGADMRGENG